MGRYRNIDKGQYWNNRTKNGLTSAQKAQETRRKNKELRNQELAKEERITKAMIDGLLSVLEAEDSPPDQKLEASKILSKLTGRGVRS